MAKSFFIYGISLRRTHDATSPVIPTDGAPMQNPPVPGCRTSSDTSSRAVENPSCSAAKRTELPHSHCPATGKNITSGPILKYMPGTQKSSVFIWVFKDFDPRQNSRTPGTVHQVYEPAWRQTAKKENKRKKRNDPVSIAQRNIASPTPDPSAAGEDKTGRTGKAQGGTRFSYAVRSGSNRTAAESHFGSR